MPPSRRTATATGSSATAMTTTATSSRSSSTASTASTIRRLLREPRTGRGGGINEREDASRLDELRRTFATLAADGDLVLRRGDNGSGEVASSNETGATAASSVTASDARVKWECWLCGRHEVFVNQLCDRVRLGRRYALRTLCGVIATTPRRERVPVGSLRRSDDRSSSMGGGRRPSGGFGRDGSSSSCEAPPRIDEDLVHRMLDALCVRRRAPKNDASGLRRGGLPPPSSAAMDEPMLNLLASEFVRPHRDAQYFTLLTVRRLAEDYAKEFDASSLKSSGADDGDDGGDDSRDEVRSDGRVDDAASAVADNLLRILEVVPIANDGDELLREGTFLFQPPRDATSGSAGRGTAQTSDIEDSDDSSNSEEDDSEEHDGEWNEITSATTGKRSRSDEVSNGPKVGAKRARTTPRKGDVSPLLHISRYRRAFEGAWFSTIRLPTLPSRSHRRILRRLPGSVLPHLHHKLRLADYLTNCYDLGGKNGDEVASLLALDGLFVLMTRHVLEHPSFYASLYARVTCRAFHARYRSRFLRLLTTCLSSSQMLPAYVVAAFCKRLCRCALSAPPSGALFVLALVSNLLRRHEACGCLVHRGGGEPIEDVYDADVDDPYKSRAIESSLWELSALERHYHPAVAALAKACGREGDGEPLHDMDEFLLHTYRSLFEQEANRRIGGKKKKRTSSSSSSSATTPLAFREPKFLFVAATEGAEGCGGDDVFGGFLSWPTRGGGAAIEGENLSGE